MKVLNMTKIPALSQEKAIEVGENCSCLAARKATRAITQLYDKHLSKVGLRITQFTLLNAIRAFDEISIHMLATELVMDRNIDRDKVLVFEGGIAEWLDDGLEVEEGGVE